MHESGLIRDLVYKINALAKEQNVEKVARVKIKLGALSHCSPDHFMEHWREEVSGSVAEHAEVIVEELTDTGDPNAQEIILESVDIEDE